MELEQITTQTRAVAVDFGEGRVLHLEYYPHELRLEDVLDREMSIERSVAQLCRILAKWDLTSGGKPVKIDAPSLRTLPLTMHGRIQQAISEDMTPGEPTGSN